MPLASVVLQLDPAALPSTLRSLESIEGLTLGEPNGAYVPGVVESRDARGGAALCEALRDVAGVAFVDVVMVDYRDEEDAEWSGETFSG